MKGLCLYLLTAVLAAHSSSAAANFLDTPAGEAPAEATLAQQAEALLQAAAAHEHFSGNVLVARGGKPIFRHSVGLASRELDVRNSADTVFRIASLSKQFTAAAVLQLQEAGKLSVDDRLCKHIQPCPPAWSSITLHHLLTHTSGIRNYSSLDDWDEQLGRQDLRRNDVIALVRDLPLEFEPGSTHHYSNSGYFLLGMIIEAVSGQRYGDYLAQRIFSPLGMRSSRYEDLGGIIPHSANGYYSRGTHFVSAPYTSPRSLFAAGGIYSTVDDLLRWDRALRDDAVLNSASRQAMFRAGAGDYGYGWYLRRFFDQPAQFHSGSASGFSAFIVRFPQADLTVIVLSNSDRASAAGLGLRLSALALGVPVELPKQQLRDLLFATIESKGVQQALKQYRQWREDTAQDFSYDEEVLTDVGYDLFETERYEDALALYRLNLEFFPDSYVSMDLIADVLAAQGDRDTAITLYRQSLSIAPDNDYAKRALARMGEDREDRGRR